MLISQGHQRSLPNHQKPGERHREDSPAQPTEGTTLPVPWFEPPELWRHKFCRLVYSVCDILLWQPSQTNSAVIVTSMLYWASLESYNPSFSHFPLEAFEIGVSFPYRSCECWVIGKDSEVPGQLDGNMCREGGPSWQRWMLSWKELVSV